MHLVVPPGGSFREPRRIELDARVLTIGRAAACDVRVDVPGVDDEHAKISEVALIAVGPDCAIGDVPLDAGQRRLVMPGDEIQIGSVVLALDGHDPAGARRAGARIRVVEGQNFGDELVLAAENHEYIIGRSPKADLVLEDREVSREHLKIVRRGHTVFIYDQASTRGSWLGRSAVYQGSKIEWQRPRMLKVGATVLSLDLPEDARRNAPLASAPMTAPPRAKPPAPVQYTAAPQDSGPVQNVVAYHYEAKQQPPPSSRPAPASHPPPAGGMAGLGGPVGAMPGPGGAGAISGAPGPMTPMGSTPPPGYHPGSMPPPSRASVPGPRTAWKRSGPTIGKASGLLLLAIAGIAILGVLFVVFSLME